MSFNRINAHVTRDRCMIDRKKIDDEKRFQKRIDEKLKFIFGEIEDACDRGELYVERYIDESDRDILFKIIAGLSEFGYVSTLTLDKDGDEFIKISW